MTTAKLDDNAVTGAKIADGTVPDCSSAKSSTARSWAPNIADGAINNTILADGSVDSDKILDNAILGADIRDGTITSADIASLGVHTIDIDDLAVTGPKLADSAVIAGKIATGAVNSAAIADGTVDTDDLRGGAVTSGQARHGLGGLLDGPRRLARTRRTSAWPARSRSPRAPSSTRRASSRWSTWPGSRRATT